jgi:hypothetical protein
MGKKVDNYKVRDYSKTKITLSENPLANIIITMLSPHVMCIWFNVGAPQITFILFSIL